MKKILIGLITVVTLLASCKNNPPSDDFSDAAGESGAAYQTISAGEAKKIMDEGNSYVLLDVRSPEEYKEAHIAGALLLPHTEIADRAKEELPNKDDTILIYCRSGVRSAAAARELAQLGYTRVYDFGGIINWPYETVGADLAEQIEQTEEQDMATLLYQGHGSLRLTTAEGKVIYVDPYAGEGYDLPADLILVTHQHNDHNQLTLIGSKNSQCQIISEREALTDGKYQVFELGYVTVEAVEAGNKNHDFAQSVGYILTLSDGLQIYISGDTSKTAQMADFANRNLNYAFLCCDGVYNMDIAEASECAALIGARHNIPYHMAPGQLFDRQRAELFTAQNSLIVEAGEQITLTKE